jgi:ribosome-binding factor A
MARKPGKRDAQTETRRDSRGPNARAPAPKTKREAPQGPSQRQLRVAEEVRHALSAVFMREEFHDPDIAGLRVTVTEVRASPDLQHMTAFVSALGKELSKAQFAGLKRLTPFLRSQIGRAVRLRYTPDLHFQPDTALDYAAHITKVMQRPEVQQDLGPKLPDDPAAQPPDHPAAEPPDDQDKDES